MFVYGVREGDINLRDALGGRRNASHYVLTKKAIVLERGACERYTDRRGVDDCPRSELGGINPEEDQRERRGVKMSALAMGRLP